MTRRWKEGPGWPLARRIPLALTALRALLAPVVVLLAYVHPSASGFAACLLLAFVSDVFDGIVARRLGVATPALRRLDSLADSLFYAAALLAAWHLHPRALLDRLPGLAALGALETLRYAVDLRKFGREASYHMGSSKLWGIALFAGFWSLLVRGDDGVAVTATIAVGIVADLEGLAISLTLREWKTDVATVFHARRLRDAGRG